MNRAEEIDAELEQLRRRLCDCEDGQGCDCPDVTTYRAQIHALTVERDDIPAQRMTGTTRNAQPSRQP